MLRISEGGGDSGLNRVQKFWRSRSQASLQNVILNLFQDLFFLPLLGKDKRMGNNFGLIDAKKRRCEVFNVKKINNLSILYGTATFPPVFSQIMDVKSDTLPSLKHIAKTILRGCKGQKICYNSDIYHHNYNGEFMKKLFGFTLNACSANIATCIRNRKAAFTLAEVLITLGIIGVVAAMTMPTLIMQHQKKVFVTRVKQTYSIVSNALLSSVADNGAPNTWNFGDDVVVSGNEGVDQLNSPENVERIAKTYFAS